MSQELTILGISAAVTAAIQLCGFGLAFALQTEKFYDILGGINFLALGIYSAIDGGHKDEAWTDNPRKVACTVVFCVSRTWLLVFLAWRAHERGGDSRFDGVKEKFFMFLFYWVFQGIWVFCISMPMILVNSSDKRYEGFSILDWVSIVAFGMAVIIEIFADVQKAIWVKKGREGGFCQIGIWKYSRHPNYFGEILQWWSAFGFAFGSGTGWNDAQWWASILSPLFTMQILLNTGGTGVMQANSTQSLKRYYEGYPEYSLYRESTSILIPFIGYKYVPKCLKRTLFFDFGCYEYQIEEQDEGENETKNFNYKTFE
mmetsp:Transcript_5243/g.10635  ORF Transcript_5243/g.10635 Transcript_5243/m.10635 type:complete len:315 (-) Transcript_5243:270-1214(-)|eukprot:CAMPEP_0113324864 /NCGR_PEP_ID=MMETSP0010_2-20120614/17332_1 /TAXON_ID=216773 ORGANISM="Corethron hystrix, Strain 308" /NCGR_SAMPLE_ID=MMETSP0010_2 /ASSEMBLY_ACC=CAM_ASM_000155 /LENGTH=314 /DNA_ID=CAMNT_0000184391 /DNA_START=241 /DNA_END=1185 /DNA_ORIENTATION=+ /assembly_acc=CAM_ASM_000155